MHCQSEITKLPACVTGDTWPGFAYAVSSDGTTTADPLASARMFFALQPEGTIALQLTSASGITIDDAAAWSITINPIAAMTLAPGYYLASIELTDSAGIVRTFDRFSLSVLSDPTT